MITEVLKKLLCDHHDIYGNNQWEVLVPAGVWGKVGDRANTGLIGLGSVLLCRMCGTEMSGLESLKQGKRLGESKDGMAKIRRGIEKEKMEKKS